MQKESVLFATGPPSGGVGQAFTGGKEGRRPALPCTPLDRTHPSVPWDIFTWPVIKFSPRCVVRAGEHRLRPDENELEAELLHLYAIAEIHSRRVEHDGVTYTLSPRQRVLYTARTADVERWTRP